MGLRLAMWLVTLSVLFTGAALLMSEDRGRQVGGLVLLLAPVILLTGLAMVYYAGQRR